jgi:RHS repeat-associated protein
MGWSRVPASALNTKQQITIPQLTIKEAGYVFVYLSYEDLSNNFAYFDDLQIVHTKTNVIQYNEYYPFGLQAAASWTRENVTGNNFLANGGTELNPASALYDLEFRNYDPVLGRMNQVDPMAGQFSGITPYNYAFNSPIVLNDPQGDAPISLAAMYGETTIMSFGTVEMHGGRIMDTGTYGGGHIAPGSGNYWADGSRYDDWSPNGGSNKFRQGLAGGLTNLGGLFYILNKDGSTERPQEKDGQLGIWIDNFTYTYNVVTVRGKELSRSLLSKTLNCTYFKPILSLTFTYDLSLVDNLTVNNNPRLGDTAVDWKKSTYDELGNVNIHFKVRFDSKLWNDDFKKKKGDNFWRAVVAHEKGHIQQFMDLVKGAPFRLLNSGLRGDDLESLFGEIMNNAETQWFLLYDTQDPGHEDANRRAKSFLDKKYWKYNYNYKTDSQ